MLLSLVAGAGAALAVACGPQTVEGLAPSPSDDGGSDGAADAAAEGGVVSGIMIDSGVDAGLVANPDGGVGGGVMPNPDAGVDVMSGSVTLPDSGHD